MPPVKQISNGQIDTALSTQLVQFHRSGYMYELLYRSPFKQRPRIRVWGDDENVTVWTEVRNDPWPANNFEPKRMTRKEWLQ